MLMVVLAFALQTTTATIPGAWEAGCTQEDVRLASAAARDTLHSGDGWVRGDITQLAEASNGRCGALILVVTATRGWAAARALPPIGGGDQGHREMIRRILEGLGPLATGPLAMDAEYADVAVRAAVAAAQDERAEMELLLTHARDLAERLAARGRRATWPRPFNLLAGELWLEVDRYEEARAAFERAARDEPSPLALIGLGRSLALLDRYDDACKTLRHVRGAAHQLATELSLLLAGCP